MSEQQTRTGGPTTVRATLAKALTMGMRRAMGEDPRVLLMGEDIGSLGGVYRVTEGLKGEFGAHRVLDTPLGEAGIVGTATGMAMRGYRPVCEIQFDGFTFPAYNQITTQLAKMHARTDGDVTVPVTIRIPYGGLVGSIEHHSESPEAQFSHTAGLRIVSPSSPQDAYWMIQQSIACPDPVIFFEPKRRYWLKGEVDLENPSTADPFSAQVLREGSELSLVAWGPLVPVAMAAAEAAAQEGRSVEVIDLRSLSPIDFATLEASVQRTGRMVVAHEAPVFSGLGAEIAARITDLSLVAWGPLVPVAMAAAEAAAQEGRSVEVIDLRSLSPIDFATLEASVQRTGRMVVAHEAPVFSGLGAEIAARITERSFYSLEAPVIRVGGYHMPYPPAGVEADYVPDLDRVLDGMDRAFAY